MATKQTFTAGQVLTAAQLLTLQDYVGVVQVKSTFKSDTFTMASTTFADVTGLSVSITPTSASNKILVLVGMYVGDKNGVVAIFTRLLRDSTLISQGDAGGSRTRISGQVTATSENQMGPIAITFLDSPATTSAVTYKIQIAGNTANTVSVNRSQGDTDAASIARAASSIIVMEVTP